MKVLCKASVSIILGICLPLAAMAAPSGWPKKLTIGLIPTESSSHVTDRFDNLRRYLEKRLGMPVELKTATDYVGIITAMRFKHLDLAYFGPQSYVEAARRANTECFAVEIAEDGSRGYHAVIIARKGSPITSIQAAKGKSFAFTDPNSTSGTLAPTVFFTRELKVDPHTYFSRVAYSGSHEASTLAVKGGTIDVAATNDLHLKRGEGKGWEAGRDFNVLWTSRLIPGSNMAYRKDIPESLKKALREAFFAYDDKEGLSKLKIRGYAPVSDDVYDTIREQMEVKKRLSRG